MSKKNGLVLMVAAIAALSFIAVSCIWAWGEWGAGANAELTAAFGRGRYPLAGLIAWLIWIIINRERKTLVWMYAAVAFLFTGASLCELQHGGYGYVLAGIAVKTVRCIGAEGLYLAAVTLCAGPFVYRKRRVLAGKAKGFRGLFKNTIMSEMENFNMFIDGDASDGAADARDAVPSECKRLQAVFDSRHVDANVINSVDQFSTVKYFVKPGAGGFAAVRSLKDDIELQLKNTVDINKEDGRITVTVNKAAGQRRTPGLNLMLTYIRENKNLLALPVGVDTNGKPLFVELFSESHMLIGGGSGSGKTTWLCSAILGLALVNAPGDLEMLLVDGKESDLAVLNPLPHLVMDVILDNSQVGIAVDYVENEINYRKSLKRKGIAHFKPFLFLIDEIDEIIRRNKSLMTRITGISGQARSFNILIIITAKHPKSEMIDTNIKANFLTRLCLKVADAPASQLILGQGNIQGAKLAGKGEFILSDDGGMIRGQGYFIDEKAKNEVTEVIRQIANTYESIPRMPMGDDETLVQNGNIIDIFNPNEKEYCDTVSYRILPAAPISPLKYAVSHDTPMYSGSVRQYDTPIRYADTMSDTVSTIDDAVGDTMDYIDDRVMELIGNGLSYRKTGNKLGISLAKVQRIVARNKNRFARVN